MSLHNTLKLLSLLQDAFEINHMGPFGEGLHSITIKDGNLMITINTGYLFKNFILDKEDLNKSHEKIVEEIKHFLNPKI